MRETTVYNFIFSLLAFYIILQPIFVLDRTFINLVTDCYNISSLVTLIFLIETFLIYKTAPLTFWNFNNTVEVISSFGILLTANMLYILPTHYYEKEILNYYLIYLLWGGFCLLKFFRIIDFLMMRVELKVLFRGCLGVLPIVLEIVTMFLIINLVFSMITVVLFSGAINTEYIEKYERITGDVIDEDYLKLNFNDTLNSFIYWTSNSFLGSYTDMTISMQIL